jgi:hypothetical protein
LIKKEDRMAHLTQGLNIAQAIDQQDVVTMPVRAIPRNLRDKVPSWRITNRGDVALIVFAYRHLLRRRQTDARRRLIYL